VEFSYGNGNTGKETLYLPKPVQLTFQGFNLMKLDFFDLYVVTDKDDPSNIKINVHQKRYGTIVGFSIVGSIFTCIGTLLLIASFLGFNVRKTNNL